tara:strand:- start:1837 stop:2712 length:876 start_codon:yes stop_codon:yes gene_type:complete
MKGRVMKKVDTLVKDILSTIDVGIAEIQPKNMAWFLEDIEHAMSRQLLATERTDHSTLRMSNIGKGDRQVWYDVNGNDTKESLTPETRLKFLFGDIIESLMLFLTKEAGHKVEHEQHMVEIEGIKGHIDAKIDGALVDVKSASSFAFKKFDTGTLADDDAFGYMAQISAYAHAEDTEEAGFLVMEKQLGKLTYMPVHKMERINPVERIKHMKKVVESSEPPERCYEPIADGKSGNMKLGVNCSYCAHKETCWSDANDGKGLRTFFYSYGPRWLTEVVREPDVPEKGVNKDA